MHESCTVSVVGTDADVASLRAGFDDRPGNGPVVMRVDTIGDEIDRLETASPACLVGMTLPGAWSPVEVLAAVRERRPDLPVVLLADDDRVHRLSGGEATTVLATDAAGDRIAAAVEGTIDRAAAANDRASRARERFETLFERVPDPVVISRGAAGGASTVVEHVNPAFEAVFGYDAEEIRGQPIDRYLVPDDEGASPIDLSDAEVGETVEAEVSRRTADGRRDFLFRGVKADVAGGVEFVGIYTEITTRKRRARRLNDLHGATRRLLGRETVEDVCETAVAAAGEILGLEATGIHLDPRVVATFDRGARTGEERLVPVAASPGARTLFDGDPPTYTVDDEAVWSVFTGSDPRVIEDVPASDVEPSGPVGSALVLPLGGFGVMISSARDRYAFEEPTVDLAKLLAANVEVALERAVKEAALQDRERELRTERDHLAALFENVPIPVASVSLSADRATVRDVNPAFESTFGYDTETIVGEDLDEYLSPPDEREAAREINRRTIDGNAVEAEVQRGTADGLREFLLTVAPVPSAAEHTTAYAFYIDITERKQRQQRLRVLSRVLRHDIRNRMNIIDGNASLIADRAGSASIERPAARIRRAAADLLDLNQKTRVVERTVAGGTGVERVDVGSALRMIASAVDDRYPDHSIAVDVPDDGAVRTTRALTIAVEELVENAAEHHDSETGRVGIEVDVGADFIEIAVVDDGPGIPADELAYVRGEREPTQVEHSSGIGLWMINWIVTTLGGELRFEDNDPRGTVVRVTVPRDDEA
jgi:PAS domain S-box-containing protein